ncbi:MAG TPA: hypothetical protein VHU82_11690 [Vicinamibacterales bacterium]|jgi:hypothetical protein|nr:hypothetical protein [Vicinamibacterales bacterium]
MRRVISSAAVLTLLATSVVSAPRAHGSALTCDVTVPNGVVAGSPNRDENSYGTSALSVGPFGLWPNGTVVFKPGGPGFLTPDAALVMKFGWTRGVSGKLQVAGRRLDGDAGPLRLSLNSGYGDVGFQASYLIFPTPGCWEVHAQLAERADSGITFVTKVVKIGEGPSGRLNPHVE